MDDHNQNGQSKLNGDQVEEQSKATSGGSTDPQTPVRDWVGGRNHKRECQCKTCLRARDRHKRSLARVASGLLPKQKGLSEKETILVDALATQAVTRGKLDKKAAGEVAGYLESSVSEKLGEERIREAFRRALHAKGVTVDRLAEVIAGGLNANDIKIVSKDGVVTAREKTPNWLARHKFLENAEKALGLMPREEENRGPVAAFHLHAPVVLIPGHPGHCTCDECQAIRKRDAKLLYERSKIIPPQYRVDPENFGPNRDTDIYPEDDGNKEHNKKE